jgi:hypothetical protein
MSSTTSAVVFWIAVVVGLVIALFGFVYAWEKWGKDSGLGRRIDRLADWASETFFDR